MTDVTPEPQVPASSFILGQKAYDVLKFVAMILLPAVGTLYFTLAQLWEWGNGEKVVGTVMAIDLFLGALLGIAARSYNNSDIKYTGVIKLVPNEAEDSTDLKFSVDPNKLVGSSEAIFKIQGPSV